MANIPKAMMAYMYKPMECPLSVLLTNALDGWNPVYICIIQNDDGTVSIPVGKGRIRIYESLNDMDSELRAQYAMAHASYRGTDDQYFGEPTTNDVYSDAGWENLSDYVYYHPHNVSWEIGWRHTKSVTVIPIDKAHLANLWGEHDDA